MTTWNFNAIITERVSSFQPLWLMLSFRNFIVSSSLELLHTMFVIVSCWWTRQCSETSFKAWSWLQFAVVQFVYFFEVLHWLQFVIRLMANIKITNFTNNSNWLCRAVFDCELFPFALPLKFLWFEGRHQLILQVRSVSLQVLFKYSNRKEKCSKIRWNPVTWSMKFLGEIKLENVSKKHSVFQFQVEKIAVSIMPMVRMLPLTEFT